MKPFFLALLASIFLSSCGYINLPITAIPSSTPAPKLTITPSVTNSPTATITPTSTISPEIAYRNTLDVEKQSLFDLAPDNNSEGLVKKFLEVDGLTNYLGYFDENNELVAIFNFEQNKENSAILLENTLLYNEGTTNRITYNPDGDIKEQKETLSRYFSYIRARVCAAEQGKKLSNNLDVAVNSSEAQSYLANGCKVTLRELHSYSQTWSVWKPEGYKYDVPSQLIHVSGVTPIVIKFTKTTDPLMIFRGGVRAGETEQEVWGFSYTQDEGEVLYMNFFNTGPAYLNNFPDYRKWILSERLLRLFSHFFGRASGGFDYQHISGDIPTMHTIYNDYDDGGRKEPILIFTK